MVTVLDNISFIILCPGWGVEPVEREDHRADQEALPAQDGRGQDGGRVLHLPGQVAGLNH